MTTEELIRIARLEAEDRKTLLRDPDHPAAEIASRWMDRFWALVSLYEPEAEQLRS